MNSNKLVSIILATKNALPHLRTAIDSLRAQSYRNFELIVQDGGSTDGTLEYLQSIVDLPRVDLKSEPDNGIGQAYNRAIQRARGDYAIFLGADERLYDHALNTIAENWFLKQPDAAVIYGSMHLADSNWNVVQDYVPGRFNLFELMSCQTVPPIAATAFNLANVGAEFYMDETLKTCPDYDLWVRLGSNFGAAKILNTTGVITAALNDQTSMSFRAEAFDQMCQDKVSILERFLNAQSSSFVIDTCREQAMSGIYAWGAEQLLGLKMSKHHAYQLLEKAANYEVSARVLRLVQRFPEGIRQKFKSAHSEFFLEDQLPEGLKIESDALSIHCLQSNSHWCSTLEITNSTAHVTGGSEPWGYSAEARISNKFELKEQKRYWVRASLSVLSGTLGVCSMDLDKIEYEEVFSSGDGDVTYIHELRKLDSFSFIVRNAGFAQAQVKISELQLLSV